MGRQVFTNAYVLLAGTDLSDHVESCTLDQVAADVNVTAMGDGGVTRLKGLEDSKLTITFWQDYAASKVDATMKGIWNGGTAVAFKVGSNGSSFSATNPSWSGTALLTNYQPLGGKVGDGLQAPVTLVVSGTVTAGTS